MTCGKCARARARISVRRVYIMLSRRGEVYVAADFKVTSKLIITITSHACMFHVRSCTARAKRDKRLVSKRPTHLADERRSLHVLWHLKISVTRYVSHATSCWSSSENATLPKTIISRYCSSSLAVSHCWRKIAIYIYSQNFAYYK